MIILSSSSGISHSTILISYLLVISYTFCSFWLPCCHSFSTYPPFKLITTTTLTSSQPSFNFQESSQINHHNKIFKTSSSVSLLKATKRSTNTQTKNNKTKKQNKNKNNNLINPKLINDFCQSTNNFWSQLVIPPIKNYIQTQPAFTTSQSPILTKLTAPPEIPGRPRPVWLTILGSVPTALGWYGYYKFSVEEELYQYELSTTDPPMVSGCGGYGTLLPFVFGTIIGFPLSLFHIPGGETIVSSAAAWILIGQLNLYRRVNELCTQDDDQITQALGFKNNEPPLYEWWALLPPPFDLIVGLRQVHFLSEFWRLKRGEEYDKDLVAEELFPFISSDRFTLKEFVLEPKRWFWFTKQWKDFELPF